MRQLSPATRSTGQSSPPSFSPRRAIGSSLRPRFHPIECRSLSLSRQGTSSLPRSPPGRVVLRLRDPRGAAHRNRSLGRSHTDGHLARAGRVPRSPDPPATRAVPPLEERARAIAAVKARAVRRRSAAQEATPLPVALRPQCRPHPVPTCAASPGAKGRLKPAERQVDPLGCAERWPRPRPRPPPRADSGMPAAPSTC